MWDQNDYLDGMKTVLCFAPQVQHFPLHGDMYGPMCSDSSKKTIRKILRGKERFSVALSPGGFSEAVYTGSRPKNAEDARSRRYEVAYLLGRTGTSSPRVVSFR